LGHPRAPDALDQVSPKARDLVLPSLVAVLLTIPCLGLGYFWDDFAFLTRVQSDPLAAVRYQPGTAFYRPISQGLYFLALTPLHSAGAVVAHALNLVLLVGSVCLLVSLVARVAGRRSGLLAGLIFAGAAPAAGLVAWSSGAQDLLAIFFLLAALHLHHSGRTGWALVAASAGLLSKETIAVVWPALMFWDVLVGRRSRRVVRPLLLFGGLAIAWGLLHPGIRFLLARGFDHSVDTYVGLQNSAVRTLHARGYVLSLFNLPMTGWNTPWPLDRLPYGVVAAVASAVGSWLITRRSPGAVPTLSLGRAVLLGGLIAIPTLLLPSFVIGRWVAYYVCLPAVGTAIVLSSLGARAPATITALALAGYIMLGIWSRGVTEPSGALLTEQSFVLASRTIRGVEREFRSLYPTLPRGSQVLVSVASSGAVGIHGTLLDGQALRIWYADPTIETRTPERRVRGAPAEYLFRITLSRRVLEVIPDRLAYRTRRVEPEQEEEARAVLRTYARGLAASGEEERSVQLLTALSRSDPAPTRSYDLRLAAMSLIAKGNRPGAERLLASAPAISRDYSLDAIAKVLGQPTNRPALDSTAYWAFGISPSDPEALRYWMAMFYGSRYYAQALHFARRLQEVVPGDRESAAIVRELQSRRGTGKARVGSALKASTRSRSFPAPSAAPPETASSP
jgi:hypothetical protein